MKTRVYLEYERYADSGGESSALQSMKGSNKYGLVRRWSTPSLPDYGIHKRYLEGDQRKWMIKCEHCGYWQEMTFKDNVKVIDKDLIDNKTRKAMPGSCMYVCQKCGKNFDSSRWYNGKWVKTRTDPNLPASFYVSQLNAVWIGPEDIYTDYLRSTNPQFFYNYTLGIPYENNQSGMNKEDFMEHRADDLPERITHYTTGKYAYVTFGIDWGTHYHHLTVLGMTAEGKFELINAIRIQNSNETGQIEEDLRQVINQINIYEPDLVYCDIGFSGNYVAKLRQLFPNKVYGVNVRSAKSNGDPTVRVNEGAGIVTIDKLTQNKILMNDIKAGRFWFWKKDDEELEMIIEHAKNVVIRDIQDEKTNQVEQVIGRRGAD